MIDYHVVLVKYKNSRIDIVSSFSSEINYSAYNNIYPLLSNNNLVTNITNKNTSIDINLDNDLFTILIKIQIKTSERYRIFNIKNIFIEISENTLLKYERLKIVKIAFRLGRRKRYFSNDLLNQEVYDRTRTW